MLNIILDDKAISYLDKKNADAITVSTVGCAS